MSFPCPTVEEIQAASDAVTQDGPGAEATALLSMLGILSPVLREARDRKVALLRSFVVTPDYKSMPGGGKVRDLMAEVGAADLDVNDVLLTGTIQSLTTYGLNLGIRVGEARREGMRSRPSIENLLAHLRDGCTEGEASRDAAIRVLQWVLGEREAPDVAVD